MYIFFPAGGYTDGSGFTGLYMVNSLPCWPVSEIQDVLIVDVAYIQKQKYQFVCKYGGTRWMKEDLKRSE